MKVNPLLVAGVAIFCLFFILPYTLQGQYKLEKLSQWDDNENIDPASDGQLYNDLVGYADDEGREYAIIGSLDGTYFVNITDPEHPELVRKVEGRFDRGINRDFQTHGHYAYGVCDQGPSSLQIFDLQYLPDSVAVVYDEDSLVQNTHNIFVSNDRLYLASHNAADGERHPLSILSLENPEVPRFITNLNPTTLNGEPLFEVCHDAHVRNDTLFCFGGNEGLFIYDYENPQSPELITGLRNYPDQGYNHSGWVNEKGNRLVFADETHGSQLKFYDISDRANPSLNSLFGYRSSDGAIPHNPFIKDSLIYVSYYHNGVVVFDKSEPKDVRKIASYDTDTTVGGDKGFSGFQGAWGVYPFLPSGTIIGADMQNGLFVLDLQEDPDASIEEQTLSNEEVSIYPNPASEKAFLEVPFSGKWELTLLNSSGKVLERQSHHLSNENEIEFDLSPDLEPGLHYLQLKHNSRVFHKKLIKQ